MRTIRPLGRNGIGKEILLDDGDFAVLSRFKWWLDGKGYPFSYVRVGSFKKNFRMHQAIVPTRPGEIPDHINRNKLDNRRQNFRITTNKNNVRNMRKRKDNKWPYKGIRISAGKSRFSARIRVDGKELFLGYHDSAEAAAMAYDNAARKHFGEFASLNFPKENEYDHQSESNHDDKQ